VTYMVTGSCNNNSVPAVMAGGSQGVLYIAPKSFMSSKKNAACLLQIHVTQKSGILAGTETHESFVGHESP